MLFDRVLMPRVVRLHDEVRVPSVAGEDLARAEAALREADLRPVRTPGRHHPLVARGEVLEVSPSPGLKVKRGREIVVTPSLGPIDRWVPDVTGMSVRVARLQLESAGLRIEEIDRAATDRIEAGRVLAVTPEPGSPLPDDGGVALLLSEPRAATPFWLPDLRGMDGAEAAGWLEAHGMDVSSVERAAPAQPGSVFDQSPPPGAPIWPGSRIYLSVTPAGAWRSDRYGGFRR